MRRGIQILEMFVLLVSVTITDRHVWAIAHSLLHCLTNKMNREGNYIFLRLEAQNSHILLSLSSVNCIGGALDGTASKLVCLPVGLKRW